MAAGIAGLNYQMPSRFAPPQAQPTEADIIQQQAAGAAPQITAPSVGGPNDTYANIQGTTDSFYNSVGSLKEYVADMWKTYGVDVTKPDYSQPGGGQPFRTFQEMSARSMMTANDLKQRMKENEGIAKGVMEGTMLATGDYEQAPLGTSMQERITATDLLPEVVQAQQRLLMPYETKEAKDEANLKIRDPLIAKFENLKTTDPTNAKFYQRQIEALNEATYQARVFAPHYPSASEETKKMRREAVFTEGKRLINHLKGAWLDEMSEVETDNDGNAYLINREFTNTPLGKQEVFTRVPGGGTKKQTVDVTLDGIVLKADGKRYFRFAQPIGAQAEKIEEILDLDITSKKGDALLKDWINNNRMALGFNYTDLVSALKENNAYDPIKGSKDEVLVDTPLQTLTNAKVKGLGDVKAKTDAFISDLDKKIREFTKGTMDKPIVVMSDGTDTYEIRKATWVPYEGGAITLTKNGEKVVSGDVVAIMEAMKGLKKEIADANINSLSQQTPTTPPPPPATAQQSTSGYTFGPKNK